MGLETSIALAIGGKILSGLAANRAAKDESARLKDQADLSRAENEAEAERVDKERSKFLARQKLSFIKGGVTLQGSPLAVLEETEEESRKEVEALRKRGAAIQSFGRQKAASVRTSGRAKLFGSFVDATAFGVSTHIAKKSAGI